MKLATIVSRIFDPINLLAAVAVVAAVASGMPQEALIRFFFILLFGMVLPPLLLLIWAIRTKKIKDWDISNRSQRVRALVVFLGFLGVDFILIRMFGNAYLVQLSLFFFLWFAGFLAITLFWKISGHTSALTLACLFFIHWFGLDWWPILLTIPLVSWARVKRKNHTVAQVVAGVLYSVSFIGLIRLIGLT